MNELESLKSRLKSLHLGAMVQLLDVMVEDGSISRMSAQSVLDALTIQEEQTRIGRKTEKLIRNSTLYYPAASVAGLIHDPQRKMNLALLDSLLICEYIKQSQPVWVLGSSGAGKTYVSCLLGKQACLLQYDVKYYTTSDFFFQCQEAEENNCFRNFITNLCKNNLIILDDFLLTGVNFIQATYLYELMNFPPNPKKPRSIIISTQLMEEEITLRLSEVSPALSESIMGRLKSKSIRLEITGKDMRK